MKAVTNDGTPYRNRVPSAPWTKKPDATPEIAMVYVEQFFDEGSRFLGRVDKKAGTER
jgi:hypothetical protein